MLYSYNKVIEKKVVIEKKKLKGRYTYSTIFIKKKPKSHINGPTEFRLTLFKGQLFFGKLYRENC